MTLHHELYPVNAFDAANYSNDPFLPALARLARREYTPGCAPLQPTPHPPPDQPRRLRSAIPPAITISITDDGSGNVMAKIVLSLGPEVVP
jgi:hypothetical protein